MYCQKCGSEVKQEQKACPKCGEPIRRGMRIPAIKFDSNKNIVPIALAVIAVLIIFAVVKMAGKSDEERIAGTWVLVEEMYGHPQEGNIGEKVIFKDSVK